MTPLDDIVFWSRQLSEHALFMQLGLVGPYASQAGALHRDWERARAQLGTDLVQAKAVVSKPTKDLRDFKVAMYDRVKGGSWSGWLFPLFIDHTRRELDYFVERVWYGRWTPSQTACANLRFMAEHAIFAAHLLDPAEAALIRQAVDVAGRFESLESGCSVVSTQFLDLSQRAGEALNVYWTEPVSAKSGTSIIHPVLAEHVVREGRRFLQTINELRGRT